MKFILSLILSLSLFMEADAIHVKRVRKQQVTPVTAITGVKFPAPSGQALSGTSFQWANTTLPHYNVTYIFSVNYSDHNYYYTNFFYSNNYGQDFDGAQGNQNYYGCHPYPSPENTSSTKYWEISTYFYDFLGPQISTGVWYDQAVVVAGTSTQPDITYYYDLANGSGNVHYTWVGTWTQSGSPNLIFGDNPWTNTPSESGDQILRNLQIYTNALSYSDVQSERVGTNTSTPVTSAGQAAKWFRNLNPTPSDISDKSGAGHNPTWTTSNRPTLWTGP